MTEVPWENRAILSAYERQEFEKQKNQQVEIL